MKIQMFWKWKQQEVVPMFILFELAKTDELNIDVPTMALLLFFLAQADKTLISCAPHGHRTTPTGPLTSQQRSLPVQRSRLRGQSAEKINTQKQSWPRHELQTFPSEYVRFESCSRRHAHMHTCTYFSEAVVSLQDLLKNNPTLHCHLVRSRCKIKEKLPDIVFPPVCLSQVCLALTGWFSHLKNQENKNAVGGVGRQHHSGWKLRAVRFRASDWSAEHFVVFSSKGRQSAIYILGELWPQTVDSFSI